MKSLVIANWKMNPKTKSRAQELWRSSLLSSAKTKDVEVVICPSFVHLSYLALDRKGKVSLGAQDCSFREQGAFTGEVSPAQLKDMGCTYCIAGHSERRALFGETDRIISQKVKALISLHMTPIICVGETQEERKKGSHKQIVRKQIRMALAGLPSRKHVLIAYEPVWAIGRNRGCPPEEAGRMRSYIHSLVQEKNIGILYGGSVNAHNVRSYLDQGFHGVLVGGASLNARAFSQIIRKCVSVTDKE